MGVLSNPAPHYRPAPRPLPTIAPLSRRAIPTRDVLTPVAFDPSEGTWCARPAVGLRDVVAGWIVVFALAALVFAMS